MVDSKILIVDDEPQVVSLYKMWLRADGYDVDEAGSLAEARERLGETLYDVVLLDQRLPGSTDTEAGLDLIAEAALGGGKVFMVTGHASEEAIDKAFALGVHDYLTKGPSQTMKAMLRHKVRRAVDIVRSERAASRQPEARDKHIRSVWRQVLGETNPQKKGKALEELLAEIFRTIPGFTVHPNEKSTDEEFDLSIQNLAPDWAPESPYFIVEAKNWSTKVERRDYDLLVRKLERRSGRARLGFLVAVGGFTAGVVTAWEADRAKPELVVLIDAEGLRSLVEASDRNTVLHSLHHKAVMGRT